VPQSQDLTTGKQTNIVVVLEVVDGGSHGTELLRNVSGILAGLDGGPASLTLSESSLALLERDAESPGLNESAEDSNNDKEGNDLRVHGG
jgi:hypothetical protein